METEALSKDKTNTFDKSKCAVYILAGIVDISLCFLLFNGQQYFSFPAMFSIMIIFVCGLFFLLLPAFRDEKTETAKRLNGLAILAALASAIAIIYQIYFDLQYSSGVYAAIAGYLPIVLAALIPIAAIYLMGKRKKLDPFHSKSSMFIAIILLVIVSIAAFYIVKITLRGVNWKGTDEIAFNYYASYLFGKGTNPYTANMMPIINKFNLDPTLRLNSSCECQYGYPALSFLPFVVLPILDINGYYLFVYVTVLCVIIAAFIVYYKSNKNTAVLLLLLSFAVIAYIITPGGDMKYAAAAVFLLIAYLERNKIYTSSAFLGLAASSHQLAWLAIPFFYIITLNTHGKKALYKSVLVSVGLFLLINSYFIALSPSSTLKDLFVFGGKLTSVGPNIMQMLVTFYPVPYWYSTILLIVVYAVALLLFYCYTRTLNILLALVPATIFFLSWSNDLVYLLAFVPLIIYIHYTDGDHVHDRIKDKKLIKYAVAALAILSVALLVYLHLSYTNSNTLVINYTSFVLNTNHTTGAPYIYALIVNVTNNGHKQETLLFYATSRNPNSDNYIVGVPPYEINPDSSRNFTIDYRVSDINRNTIVRVFVLSNDYIQSTEFSIPNISANGS